MNKKNPEANGTQTAALSHEAETKQSEQTTTTTTATETRHDSPAAEGQAVQISRAAIADMIAAIADIRSTFRSGEPTDLQRAIERATDIALDFGICLE